MTIAELLGRISRAFTRTFDLVMEGAFGDLWLLDLGIVVVISVVSLIVVAILWSIYDAITRTAPVEPESDKWWVLIGIVAAALAIVVVVGIVALWP